MDTAERKFCNRGNLWEKITTTKVIPKNNARIPEDNEQVLLVKETKLKDDIEVSISNGMVNITIPSKTKLHEVLNKEANKLHEELPNHKIDNFVSLTARLKKSNEMKDYLKRINYPYCENEDGLVIGINSLSDSGAGLALGTPEFIPYPLLS